MQIDKEAYNILKEALTAQLVTVRRLGDTIEAALRLIGDVAIADAKRALAEFDAAHPEIVARIGPEAK